MEQSELQRKFNRGMFAGMLFMVVASPVSRYLLDKIVNPRDHKISEVAQAYQQDLDNDRRFDFVVTANDSTKYTFIQQEDGRYISANKVVEQFKKGIEGKLMNK